MKAVEKMRTNEIENKVAMRCSPFDRKALQEIVSHFSRDYLQSCSGDEISSHLNVSQSLTPDNPVRLWINQEDIGKYKIVVVAFDYFSEFSIICGLLSSFGLNITSGSVQTLNAGTGRKKIIDLFRVESIGPNVFDTTKRQSFKKELLRVVGMLEADKFREARRTVNLRLIAQFGQIQGKAIDPEGPLKGLLTPIEIRFDNSHSPQWTILSIRGKDAPAFLYAFSNALAMRNIYIHRVKINRIGEIIHNRLYISNRRGKKISRDSEKKALKISAVLIKQFLHFLSVAPDPMMAITHFDQFLDKILETADSSPFIEFLKKKDTMDLLARFFGTSNFLWEDFLRIRFENFFPILEHLKKKPIRIGKKGIQRELQQRLRKVRNLEEARKTVNAYKDEEMFRIDMRHLLEPHFKLTHFSEALTDLAEVVVQSAYKICNRDLQRQYGTPLQENRLTSSSSFAICGFGKFGGRELGYASDIELLFVYESNGKTTGQKVIENKIYFELLSQKIIDFIKARQEGIFSIDTRLRPYGKSGPLAVSLEQFSSYYAPEGKAAYFERQALIKLRAVAGSQALGKKCEIIRDRFVYSGSPWDRDEALSLRKRQIDELVPKGQINVKYSEGGIIDIEYLIQYLQIIQGKDYPELHTANTLKGLAALAKTGIIPQNTAINLSKSYLFMRELIDALRIVRGNAKDLLLPEKDSEEFVFLSRRMGFTRRNWEKGTQQLEAAIKRHMREAHRCYRDFIEESKGYRN